MEQRQQQQQQADQLYYQRQQQLDQRPIVLMLTAYIIFALLFRDQSSFTSVGAISLCALQSFSLMHRWRSKVVLIALVIGVILFLSPFFVSLIAISLCLFNSFLLMRTSRNLDGPRTTSSRRRGEDGEEPLIRNKKKILVVLGSGGHTTEMMLMLKSADEAQMRRNTYHFVYTSEHCKSACTKAMAGNKCSFWWISRSRSVRKD